MICDTLKKYQDVLRSYCCKCDGAKKLVNCNCTSINCDWYETRKSLIEKSFPISLFNSAAFYELAINFLEVNRSDMLSQMYWSDIRLTIEKYMDEIRAKKPTGSQKSWWGKLSRMMHRAGWIKTTTSRYSPINRAQEFMYVQISSKKDAA